MTSPPSLASRVPDGPLPEKWDLRKAQLRIISPANKRKLKVIVVGSGLAGASAAASLAELGYQVTCLCFQDSARRAHSVAAQGGINAAKNYQNDGDNVHRLFLDTLRGGDYRSREANVYRLAQLSVNIIDQCVAQGVPFAREYGGMLTNRSFGGVQVQRTFYCRGQTGQQLLLGAYQALSRQVELGHVTMLPRHEMLDLVQVDGRARGVITRDLVSGRLDRHGAHAVVLASGGYGKIFYLATLAMNCNATAIWRAHKRGALMANPSWTQIHPTCIPPAGAHSSKLTLMSESLRNDGRLWVPTDASERRSPNQVPDDQRDYYLERKYPSYGNLAPRDIASRAAREVCDEGRGVGPGGRGVYMDFRDALAERGRDEIAARYGNLFAMYRNITGIDAYAEPMVIYPAAHFSMGGLWVDYDLMTTLPGLFAIGECNFGDHGANRLGANSLLQACVDGYFILPYTLGDYLVDDLETGAIETASPAFAAAEEAVQQRLGRLLEIGGQTPVDVFHRELGQILWEECAMVRHGPGLQAAIERIQALRARFWAEAGVPGSAQSLNQELEKAGRVADYLELGELMCRDALQRDESCGVHFRRERQTPDGEALRDDAAFQHVSAWRHEGGPELSWTHHAEPLTYETAQPTVRSYA